MTLRDFLILVAVSLIWSVNNVISKVVVGMWHVPPMFYADLRFAVVLLVTLPWLRPAPRPLWRLLLIGTLLVALGVTLFQHAGLLSGGTAGLAFLALGSVVLAVTGGEAVCLRPGLAHGLQVFTRADVQAAAVDAHFGHSCSCGRHVDGGRAATAAAGTAATGGFWFVEHLFHGLLLNGRGSADPGGGCALPGRAARCRPACQNRSTHAPDG